MAHKFEFVHGQKRTCSLCGKSQLWAEVCRKETQEYFFAWRPLIGRCTSHKDGRPPKTRLAVMKAIEAGRHTPVGIAAWCSLPVGTVRNTLSLAKRALSGLVVNPSRGRWELTAKGRWCLEKL